MGNIKRDLKQIRLDNVDWIHFAQDRNQALWNMVMKPFPFH
jgi:hypothetical protein